MRYLSLKIFKSFLLKNHYKSKASKAMFEAGINAIVLGDYLTTKGEEKHKDVELILKSGYEVAKSC
ncbi:MULTISPECIES: hypothetical protein [unclassified Campylobacter]|uniref:hypothetical protein n=1 Tax=unclassified Campylobacter TaxID=2593542 RepID=UPI0030148DBD